MDSKERTLDKVKAIRQQRYKEIEETTQLLNELSQTEYIYFLLEPDRDVIRYIGVAVDPRSRFSNHLWSSTNTRKKRLPVHKWIAELIDTGTLPRMWVVSEVTAHSWRYISHLDCGALVRCLEKLLVHAFTKNFYIGNGRIPADLLNIEHMPDIFLPKGIDAQQDR